MRLALVAVAAVHRPQCSRRFRGCEDGRHGRHATGEGPVGPGVLRGARPKRRQHPKALAEYGIGESRYTSEEEMFDLVHAMRTRVITDPAFGG
jgi:hypothetical protein